MILSKHFFDTKLPYFVLSFTILKKITAILLISTLLFNMVGYKMVFAYLEKNATTRLEKKIDAGQDDDSHLVEIKIKINLPYYSDSKYETCYGETEFNGEYYRYVKIKVSGNTLYLLCLPHTEKDTIVATKAGFVKAVNDIPQNDAPAKNQASFIKLMLSSFLQEEKINDFTLPIIAYKNLHSSEDDLLSQFKPKTAAQPPDIL